MKQVYVVLVHNDVIWGASPFKEDAWKIAKSAEKNLGYDGKTQRAEVQRFIAVPQLSTMHCVQIEDLIKNSRNCEISVQELRDIIFQECEDEPLPHKG